MRDGIDDFLWLSCCTLLLWLSCCTQVSGCWAGGCCAVPTVVVVPAVHQFEECYQGVSTLAVVLCFAWFEGCEQGLSTGKTRISKVQTKIDMIQQVLSRLLCPADACQVLQVPLVACVFTKVPQIYEQICV